MKTSSNMTRFQRTSFFLFFTTCSFATLVNGLTGQLRNRFHPTGPALWLLALLPSLPVLAMIAVALRYFAREKDEFVRSLVAQALIWGVCITLAIDTTWGFFTVMTGCYALPQFFNFPLCVIATFLSLVILNRRYR